MTKKSTFSLTDITILAAFCMFLSLIEYMIPKPMPFMRLGLAHLPVLLSLTVCSPGQTLLLTLLKVLGQGLVNGTLFSYIFLFSTAGSFSSTLVMIAVYRLLRKRVSLVGVSTAGAMASNTVQILLARRFIFGDAAVLIAPPFLAVGIASSIVLGLFAAEFSARSKWIQLRMTGSRDADSPELSESASGEDFTRDESPPGGTSPLPRFAFICGLLSIPGFLFQPDARLMAAGAAVFILLSVAGGKKFKPLPVIVMAAGVIAANLITPFGRVLFQIGRFSITAGALETGVMKAGAIIGLIYISRASVRRGLRLPGRIGSILSLVFFYFEELTSGDRLRRGNITMQLDARLIELSRLKPGTAAAAAEPPPPPQTASAGRKGADYIIAAMPLLVSWGMFAAGQYL